MKLQLQQLINQYPKHYTRMIKKDTNINKFVETFIGNTIAEKAYNALHNPITQCPHGQQYKFKGITQGYSFCGRANACKCARESVSLAVSNTKKKFTEEKKQQIQSKKINSLNKKYNVNNAGKLKHAIQNHADFYNNSDNVNTVVSKVQQTKLIKYGNSNYNNPEKIKQTFKEKDTVFWQQRFPEKDISTLHDKLALKKMFETIPITDIATTLGVHIQTVYQYLNKHKIKSPYQSSYEQEIVLFLQSLGITNIIRNTRKLLPSGKEIDIYLPDYRLAIEFNGIYWHHEDISHITRSYHKNKFIEAEYLGIQLITIFSNFWNTRKDIVKQSLINKLGLDTQSIYARQTVVRLISAKHTTEFLNKNHIQGYTPASVCYGLFDHNDILVAVMTFSRSRIALGKQTRGFELVRYASALRVVGGAGKLLAAFCKEYPDQAVYSYSNNEWSNGSLYKTLGFDLERDIDVSYWYIHPREEKLMHRFNFSKQKLIKKGYDKLKTEKEICKEIGLLKVWDCGKRRWMLESSNSRKSGL